MIRTEREYKQAKQRLVEESERLALQRAELAKMGLAGDQLERAMAPMISFHLQLQEEVESYEGLLRGEIRELVNLHGLGQILVGVRIARGMTQRQLAETLGVDESQVSRDERNEYHGVTVERASRILDALCAELRSRVQAAVAEEPAAATRDGPD